MDTILMLCVITVSIIGQFYTEAESPLEIFEMVTNRTKGGTHRLDAGWTERSQVTCGINCIRKYQSVCGSFMFNQVTGLCTPGGMLNDKEAPPTGKEGDLYIRYICDTDLGFKLYISAHTAMCATYITKTAIYSTAKEFCKSLKSHLFTVKSPEKLAILRNITRSKVYVGLNDIKQEGKFVWEDNGQEIDGGWKKIIFSKNEPNNRYGFEDCVAISSGLNDVRCSYAFPYVCEKPII